MGPTSPDFYSALIQATKWAFEKRDRYLCDPLFHEIPIPKLLAPCLASAERPAWLNDLERHSARLPAATPPSFVSLTAKAMPSAWCKACISISAPGRDPQSGVLLQNRGSFFSLDPQHPNALQPGKQSASTLMSGMLCKDGQPYLVYGSQGGEVQPQAQTALVTRIVDFDLDIQSALDAPRLLMAAPGAILPTSFCSKAARPSPCSMDCVVLGIRSTRSVAASAHGNRPGDPAERTVVAVFRGRR